MATQPINKLSAAELAILATNENADVEIRLLALWRAILVEADGVDAASTVVTNIQAQMPNGIGGINA